MKHPGRKFFLPVAAVAIADGSFAFLASNRAPVGAAIDRGGVIEPLLPSRRGAGSAGRQRHRQGYARRTRRCSSTSPRSISAPLRWRTWSPLGALVEIAKKYETVIMALPHADGHDYLLWDDGLAFRFRTSPPTAAAPRGRRTAKPLDALRGDDEG